jgi:hypothetical protein
MQNVAKIIRHRHINTYTINDRTINVSSEDHYKLTFSDSSEHKKWSEWLATLEADYSWSKAENVSIGRLPKDFECWCDVMSYFLLHVHGYKFHSVITPYKGEIFVKD